MSRNFMNDVRMSKRGWLTLARNTVFALALLALATPSQAWWNKDWTARKSFTLDTTKEGGAITDSIGGTVVLLRLHEGNFPFDSVGEDGSDMRFVAEDDKTALPYQIEKYDSLLNEAFVWVKVPDVKPGAQTRIWLYYGSTGKGAAAPDAKKTYDDDTVLAYHFGEKGAAPVDSSAQGNTAGNAGTPAEGSMIGNGIRLLGGNPITIPASDSLKWNAGGAMTWSAWIKAASHGANAVIFSRVEGSNAFRIGVDQGVPYVEVADASGTLRSPAGAPIETGIWKHLAVTAEGGKIALYVDGESYATLGSALPSLVGPATIGVEGTDNPGFLGELDELEISRVARPAGAIKLEAIGQSGSDRSTKLLVVGSDEGGESKSAIMEHLSLFTEIGKSLTFDGWVVIGLCTLMAVLGWFVAIRKFFHLNRIKRGSNEFLKQWNHLSSDLTQLDHTDEESVKSMGGKAGGKAQRLMHQSPIFHLYHIGSREILHRLQNTTDGFKGLSARSIQAIRASLEGGLTREVQGLNGDLIFLTISIAGGPYLGLLGTVIGVMITFATIAKTGQVEVNSIAPGIAGALLATVAGLLVAIPALFIYSYLNGRIKDAVSNMQTFVDEFIAKVAEFYPEAK